MRDDLKALRARAEEIGKGTPKDSEVFKGHKIEHYGSPEKEKGYTLHFIDPRGNELPSCSNNVRDIEALCAAMIGNQMGEYASYSRDLAAFDVLLLDMYELMVPEITWQESEIYICLYGCEQYHYHCDAAENYDE